MTERPRNEAELIELVRAIDVRAPDSLHQQVEQMIAAKSAPRGARSGRGLVLAGAGALAALVAVLAIALSGAGGASGPSLHQAAALTLSAATQPPPAESGTDRTNLSAAVDGVSFPYWEGRLGWRSTGARADSVGGRHVTTVFYADRANRQIGYAIVGGQPAPSVSGGTIVYRDGHPYRLSSDGGVAVVTWLRAGHLCVVAGRGVDQSTLLRLASWHAAGEPQA